MTEVARYVFLWVQVPAESTGKNPAMRTPPRNTRDPVPLDVSYRFRHGRVMTPGDREDWKRLASYVVSGRLAAGYKDRRALAAATGVTDRTLGTLENGRRVSAETLAVVEKAVGWKPDSARHVLAGGEPQPAEGLSRRDSDGYPLLRYADPRVQKIADAAADASPLVRRAVAEFARILLAQEEEEARRNSA